MKQLWPYSALQTSPLATVLCALTLSAAAGEPPPLVFVRTTLDTQFRSEGVAVADIDQDGRKDVIVGDYWYQAPLWEPREIRTPTPLTVTQFSEAFGVFADEISGDLYPDIVVIPFHGGPVKWYENPSGLNQHWQEHTAWGSYHNEHPTYVDVTGNGRHELVTAWSAGKFSYFQPNAHGVWQENSITPKGAPGAGLFDHGMGVGDMNGDARLDLITMAGWYVQPLNPQNAPWPLSPAPLPGQATNLHAYDVNADGVQDIITSSPHNYGLWWYEGHSNNTWTQHLIDDSWSAGHSLQVADLDGDGLKDIVTGKRWYAHNGNDVGAEDPVVLYWYRLQRPAGERPRYDRYVIAADGAGVGTQFTVTDISGDGLPDIATSNKRGVRIYIQATDLIFAGTFDALL